jgi:hypothetical protein
MKTLHIEFIHSQKWKWVWLVAAVCVSASGILYVRQYREHANERKIVEMHIHELNKQLLPIVVQPTAVNPRRNTDLHVANTLQNDLNRVFTAIEVVKEPNTRLRNLSLDASSSTVRLEYEIDTVARATSVTLSLNAGYTEAVWRLESINAVSMAAIAGAPPITGVPVASLFRAIWSVNSGKL